MVDGMSDGAFFDAESITWQNNNAYFELISAATYWKLLPCSTNREQGLLVRLLVWEEVFN